MGEERMKVSKRRRQENRTDYFKRRNLLKSETPRIVFRKTNRYLIAQYIESKEAQDKIIFGLNSKQLLKYGWPKNLDSALKNTPAAYLFGIMTGIKITHDKLKTPILDFGLQRVLKGSKTQAFIKGLVDSGIKIKHKEENFPSKERIHGKQVKEKIPFEEIKLKIDKEK
jgi:large subunit ribosomal protein L18